MTEEFYRKAIERFPGFQPMECPEVKAAWFNAYSALFVACLTAFPPAHPEATEPSSQQEPINQELLTALKESREVLHSCATDTAGTPTEDFFKAKVRHCDIVIAKAEGRDA